MYTREVTCVVATKTYNFFARPNNAGGEPNDGEAHAANAVAVQANARQANARPATARAVNPVPANARPANAAQANAVLANAAPISAVSTNAQANHPNDAQFNAQPGAVPDAAEANAPHPLPLPPPTPSSLQTGIHAATTSLAAPALPCTSPASISISSSSSQSDTPNTAVTKHTAPELLENDPENKNDGGGEDCEMDGDLQDDLLNDASPAAAPFTTATNAASPQQIAQALTSSSPNPYSTDSSELLFLPSPHSGPPSSGSVKPIDLDAVTLPIRSTSLLPPSLTSSLRPLTVSKSTSRFSVAFSSSPSPSSSWPSQSTPSPSEPSSSGSSSLLSPQSTPQQTEASSSAPTPTSTTSRSRMSSTPKVNHHHNVDTGASIIQNLQSVDTATRAAIFKGCLARIRDLSARSLIFMALTPNLLDSIGYLLEHLTAVGDVDMVDLLSLVSPFTDPLSLPACFHPVNFFWSLTGPIKRAQIRALNRLLTSDGGNHDLIAALIQCQVLQTIFDSIHPPTEAQLYELATKEELYEARECFAKILLRTGAPNLPTAIRANPNLIFLLEDIFFCPQLAPLRFTAQLNGARRRLLIFSIAQQVSIPDNSRLWSLLKATGGVYCVTSEGVVEISREVRRKFELFFFCK